MSILTSNAYRYISLALLITCFSLVCYIITFKFIELKVFVFLVIFQRKTPGVEGMTPGVKGIVTWLWPMGQD